MIDFLKKKMLISVRGKHIKRFIKKMNDNDIELLKIDYKSEEEIFVLIYEKDFDKIINLKTIYEVTNTENYGFLKLKKLCKKFKLFIFSFLIGLFIFFCLINLVFEIDVKHNDPDMRKLIVKELDNFGIKRYHFKKSYSDVQKIKNRIVQKYPDKIDWMEIKEIGTKYIVYLEERKINNKVEEKRARNIVAKKNGVIKKIISNAGDSLISVDSFVNKGDVLISGEVMLNDEVKGRVSADGRVYAEVWYTLNTSYSYVKYKEVGTGKIQKNLVLNFLNKKLELKKENNYKNISEKKLIGSNLLPFYIGIQRQEKIKYVNEILTYDEAIERAEDKLTKDLESNLSEKEYIIFSKKLKSKLKDSKIELEMFFAVYEDITAFEEIGEENAEK